jgi:methionine synthase II (cobalamin-independent)
MSKQHTPFRFETVGSFLRPDYLKKARLDFENGKITKEELTAVEDKAILDLVAKQKKAGIKEQHGILTSCGDLTELNTKKPKTVLHSTANRL